jgi:hypothetical protein
MNFLISILRQKSGISKPQMKFISVLLNAIIATTGKINFRNLSRYCDYCEKTLSRNFRKPFDFLSLNLAFLNDALFKENQYVLAIDCSFIPKSGKKTYGIAKFYNGSHSRSEKGLEFFFAALVDNVFNTAFALQAFQTPPTMSGAESRTDFYISCLKSLAKKISKKAKYVVADGFFAKLKFVKAIDDLSLNLICKLRSDANLKTIYTGKQKQKGRRKIFDKKIVFNSLEQFEFVKQIDSKLSIYTTLAYSATFKRLIRICFLVKNSGANKFEYAILFSTNIDQDAVEIYEIYKSRFQIEFVFRDAKQFTGLCDCQATKKETLDFHVNASLTALNYSKINAIKRNNDFDHKNTAISIASEKRIAFNELFLENIFSNLDINLSLIKLKPFYERLRKFGAIAA